MANEPFRDPFETPTENDAVQNTPGSNCEVAFCDARYTATGDRTFLNTGTKRYFDAPRKSGLAFAALSVTRFYDKEGDLEYTETSIRSVHIKKALQTVVKSGYPGLNLTSSTPVTRDFLNCLYFHHKELRVYGQSLEDEEAARHLNLVLEHLYQNLGHNMQTFRENVDDNCEIEGKHPVLAFEHLWMAFCPGDLVASQIRDKYSVHQVKQTHYNRSLGLLGLFFIELQSLRCDGEHIGYSTRTWHIRELECPGFTRLHDLPIKPLKYLKESFRNMVLKDARLRGEKFIRLSTGIHHCDYDGLAEMTRSEEDGGDEYSAVTQLVKGRVMIDSSKFSKVRPEHVRCLSKDRPQYNIERMKREEIPEAVKVLVSNEIFGFSLTRKSWGKFDMDFCEDVCYNQHAFSKLVLPQQQKDLIRSLVTTHEKGKLGFDDIIEGKGKGMTMLLHGTPGVGKTLTAESVAEHAEKPLYAVTAADFTNKITVIESKLNDVFDLAAHWNAVLLIDEADVILTRRTFADVERNAVVAVFLRALEYYNGVLILTTNRVTSLDTAFRSRIHLGIKYQSLSVATRKNIWQTFLERSTSGSEVDVLGARLLDEFAAYQFDGRMIKNAVRMAHAVAVDEDIALNATHIRKAIEALEAFRHDMVEADEEEEKEKEGEEAEHQCTQTATSEGSRKRRRIS